MLTVPRPSLLRVLAPALVLASLVLALGAPASALARGGGGGDVRVSGTCGRGATSQLRLETKDGGIRVEFRVRGHRRGERWRVVLVHERRVAWRGRARTGSSNSFRVRRSLPDFGGADQVTARASGPRGNTCQATASVAGA